MKRRLDQHRHLSLIRITGALASVGLLLSSSACTVVLNGPSQITTNVTLENEDANTSTEEEPASGGAGSGGGGGAGGSGGTPAASGPVDPVTSTLAQSRVSIAANGSATSTITITARNAGGEALSGKAVTLTSNRGATDTVTTVLDTTDSNGVATFTVRSSTLGDAELTATADGVTLSGKGSLLFLGATPLTDYQARLAASLAPGNNTSPVNSCKDLASSAVTNDGALNGFAYSTASGWGGDGTTAISSGATGPYRLILDGSDDYVTFGNGANSESDFSFETWIRPGSVTSAGKVILSNGQTSSAGTASESNRGLTLRQARDASGKLELLLGEKSYSQEVLADAPLGYWRLGERADVTAYDSSGNSRHGTYAGTYTLGQAAAIGDSDTSVDFSGTGSQVDAGSSPVFQFTQASPFTVEAWVNPALDSQDRAILGNAWSNEPGYHLRMTTANRLRFIVITGGAQFRASDTAVLTAGWHHVVGTWDGTTSRTYLDGQLDATFVNQGVLAGITSTRNLKIGYTDIGGGRFRGKLDEVAIYAGALDANRIAAHYHAGQRRLACASASALSNSAWHHLAGVFSSAGASLKLYVDGIEHCTATRAGLAFAGSTQDLRIGRDTSAANSWTGAASDLRTYGAVLSPSEIEANRQAVKSRVPVSEALPVIAGLKLWLKADEIRGLNEGDPVPSWNDASGTGNTLYQATAANRPVYRANASNGKPGVQFDGSNDYYTFPLIGFPTGSAARTVISVFKAADLTSRNLLLTYGNSAGGQVYAFEVNAYNNNSPNGKVGLSFWLDGRDTTSAVAVANAGALYSATYAGGTVSATSVKLHANGTEYPTALSAGATGNLTINTPATNGRIGTQGAGPYFMNGTLLELLFYEGALSDSDRQAIEAYLNAKYALY